VGSHNERLHDLLDSTPALFTAGYRSASPSTDLGFHHVGRFFACDRFTKFGALPILNHVGQIGAPSLLDQRCSYVASSL
jgi:hypothetical protein